MSIGDNEPRELEPRLRQIQNRVLTCEKERQAMAELTKAVETQITDEIVAIFKKAFPNEN